ncbi:hypothetical protein ES705_41575 [subsurface metagenome]
MKLILIENFSEYPKDDMCKIFTDGIPEEEGTWSEGLEGYGVDFWDVTPGQTEEFNPDWNHFYDLFYTPYRISTNDYGPQVGRHTAAIYAYDFDESNTKTMYTLNVTKLEFDKDKHVHQILEQANPDNENWDGTMCELWTLNPLQYGGKDASGNHLYGDYDLGNYLIKQPLNKFLMSKKPYSGFNANTPGEEWDSNAIAIDGKLTISYTDGGVFGR